MCSDSSALLESDSEELPTWVEYRYEDKKKIFSIVILHNSEQCDKCVEKMAQMKIEEVKSETLSDSELKVKVKEWPLIVRRTTRQCTKSRGEKFSTVKNPKAISVKKCNPLENGDCIRRSKRKLTHRKQTADSLKANSDKCTVSTKCNPPNVKTNDIIKRKRGRPSTKKCEPMTAKRKYVIKNPTVSPIQPSSNRLKGQKIKKKNCFSACEFQDEIKTSTPLPKAKHPTKGTLKRKRWVESNLKNDHLYEDDLYAEKKFYLFHNTLEENEDEIYKMETPKWSIALSPRESCDSPQYEEVISLSELNVSRKEAEEYQFRRKKRMKMLSSSSQDTPTPGKKSEKDYDVLKTIEEACKIIEHHKAISRDTEETDSEDDYYSDLFD